MGQQREADWLIGSYADSQWTVVGKYGKEIPLFFDWLLPDGTRLDHPANSTVCETLKAVIFGMRQGPNARNTAGEVLSSTLAELRNFVCWMGLQGLRSFSDLDEDDVRLFIVARSKGLEFCLDTVARVNSVLASSEEHPENCPTWSEILKTAGIDPRCTNMLRTSQAVRDFRVHHNLAVKPSNSRGVRAGGEISDSTLYRILQSVRLLWNFKDELAGNGLNFDPAETVNDVTLGTGEGRTPTLPADQAMYLLDRACRWVVFFGDRLIDHFEERQHFKLISKKDRFPPGSAIHRSAIELVSGEGKYALPSGLEVSRPPRHGKAYKPARPTTGRKVSMVKAYNGLLPTACFIVIAAFTARRHGEALSVEVGAITGSADDGFWLRSLISKTLQTVDVTPCPAIVAKAIALLERWSEPGRGVGETDKLFTLSIGQGSPRSAPYRPEASLNDFAREVRVPALPDGSQWFFTPHQFRRIFAIMYVWRYDMGDLGALSHHLRHFNIEMTRRYVTDAEMGRLSHEEGRSFAVSKIMAIAHGDSQASGTFGKKVTKLVERLRRVVVLTGPDDMTKAVERMVDRLGLTVRGTPWGFCGCKANATDLALANCQQPTWQGAITFEGLPDVAASSSNCCAGCIFNMVDYTRQSALEGEISSLRQALAQPGNAPIIAAVLKQRLAVLRNISL